MHIGYQEWVRVAGLRVRAKVDTGARTSALHATDIRHLERHGEAWVRFLGPGGTPFEAPLLQMRVIRDSGGHATTRPIVRLPLEVAGRRFVTQFSLIDRAGMRVPVLLGRRALRGFHVDVAVRDVAGILQAA